MGYTSNESRVRIDIFRKSGKWYTSGSVDMNSFYLSHPDEAVILACQKEFGMADAGEWPLSTAPRKAIEEYIIVCLEPHCEHSFPVMIDEERWKAIEGRLKPLA